MCRLGDAARFGAARPGRTPASGRN
jgi:hypothetical protein